MMAAAAMSFALSGAAFAAAPATDAAPVGQPQIGQPQIATAGGHKTVAKAGDREVIGDRETAALNTLEAAGYYHVKDIRPDGRNISVDAQKNGGDFVALSVAPNGKIAPAATPAT
jgi:hypothetical protein